MILESLVFSLSVASAFIQTSTVDLKDSFSVDQWDLLSKNQKKTTRPKSALGRAALFESVKNWEGCTSQLSSEPDSSPLRDWVILLNLKCAEEWAKAESPKTSKAGSVLKDAISLAEKFSFRESLESLEAEVKTRAASGSLTLGQWYKDRSQWKGLKAHLNKLIEREDRFNSVDRSRIYVLASEVSVSERKWEEAYRLLERAKLNDPSTSVDSRVKMIVSNLSSSLKEKLKDEAPLSQPTPLPVTEMAPSTEETELFQQAQSYLGGKEQLNGVAAMTTILKKYPMGSRSQWAEDKLMEMLRSEMAKAEKGDGVPVAKQKILESMAEVDFERLANWGRQLFKNQNYEEAAVLLAKAGQLMGGAPKASKEIYLAARSYQLSGQNKAAKDLYAQIGKGFSNSDEFQDALFHWGLINYNEGEFSEAITHLESSLTKPPSYQHLLRTQFWLYQSYKAKKAEAETKKAAEELITRFPTTYYGLIAYSDQNGKLPKFEEGELSKKKVAFSTKEKLRIERATLLLSAGLFGPAGDELKSIATRPLKLDEALYLAHLYVQAFKYSEALSIMADLPDEIPEKKSLVFLKQFFPQYFLGEIKSVSNQRVDPLLILSVMRQESAYDRKAVSRSGALGLLQMLPSTAQELARELNLKVEFPDDAFDPSINIKLASLYLSRLITKFQGSVPLALAAYNAGPGRMSRFMAAYGPAGGKGVLKDTWVDELPWSETSIYVKSILKNYLIYRIMYKDLEKMPTPPWSDGPKSGDSSG